MPNFGCAVLLVCMCAATPTLAADRAIQLAAPTSLRKDIPALPQIADPADDAERRINAALKRLDRNVMKASADCKGGDWQRSVDVPMTGPGFLSLTITDSFNCDGTAHPDAGTMSIVYDLATGRPVDWTHLLPASLSGAVDLEEQADGTKVVTLASKRLFDLYMAGYRAGEAPSADLDACKQAFLESASGGPPAMMVWLDAKGGGLAVQVDLEHAQAACVEPVVISAAVLRTEGAQPALLKAFAATPSASTAASAAKLPLRPGFYVNAAAECGEASQAIVIQFTGTAFEAGSELCMIVGVTNQGTAYSIAEHCQEQTSGKTRSPNATIVVPDTGSFSTGGKGVATRYRYCAVDALPASWKNARETIPDFPAFAGNR